MWDVATGECVATLNARSALAGLASADAGVPVHVVIWLRRSDSATAVFPDRAAHRVCVGRQDAQGVGRNRSYVWTRKSNFVCVKTRVPLYFCVDLEAFDVWSLRLPDGQHCVVSGSCRERVQEGVDSMGSGAPALRALRASDGVPIFTESALRRRSWRCRFPTVLSLQPDVQAGGGDACGKSAADDELSAPGVHCTLTKSFLRRRNARSWWQLHAMSDIRRSAQTRHDGHVGPLQGRSRGRYLARTVLSQ